MLMTVIKIITTDSIYIIYFTVSNIRYVIFMEPFGGA